MNSPQVLRVQPPVILAFDALVSLQHALPAHKGKGEPIGHSCLCLIQPVPASLSHPPKVFGRKLNERPIFELTVLRRREGMENGVKVMFGQQVSVGQVKMVFLDAVIASRSLAMTALLPYAKFSDLLPVLALAHIIYSHATGLSMRSVPAFGRFME